jgi:hypothetical protein
MSTPDVRMWELVEAAARIVTDEVTGRFEHKAFVDEIFTRLRDNGLEPNVRAVAQERVAKALADSFIRARNPKPGKPATMFDPGAVLPLGNGKRIWMEYAGANDLIEWARLSTRNLARVATAEGARQAYVAARLAAFLEHAGWLLGRIEREVFGYADAPRPHDEYDDLDEWDEGQ